MNTYYFYNAVVCLDNDPADKMFCRIETKNPNIEYALEEAKRRALLVADIVEVISVEREVKNIV